MHTPVYANGKSAPANPRAEFGAGMSLSKENSCCQAVVSDVTPRTATVSGMTLLYPFICELTRQDMPCIRLHDMVAVLNKQHCA
jgi:hypothetical protein